MLGNWSKQYKLKKKKYTMSKCAFSPEYNVDFTFKNKSMQFTILKKIMEYNNIIISIGKTK